MERYIDSEELDALKAVIKSQRLCRLGIEGFVSMFENKVGEHFGREYVYALNSGTSANEAMIAGLGLQPGDEVICPAVNPIFPALGVLAAGCIPIFAEVDSRTLLLSPEGIKERISKRTKAIQVVHHFGQPAPMDEIMDVASLYNLKVVEDCAEAYDCYYKGKKVGTFGEAAMFSLQQSKHITSGEGGFIITNDSEIYKRVELYSNCGMPGFRYNLRSYKPEVIAGYETRGHFTFGHNYRMSELQGAVALVQLGKIEYFNSERKKLVKIIAEELKDCPKILCAHTFIDPETQPNYWMYPVQLNPEETSFTAKQVNEMCLKEKKVQLGYFNDTVNYLEFVFQKMQRERRTPFGYSLPEYVSYKPGICPKGEDAAKRTIPFSVHHGRDPKELGAQVRALKDVMMHHFNE
ncbi:UDP-4-amino-4-deoxy-L-arabinose--oxoglutarate aminotransferase [subsurface metagenome]